MKSHPFFKGIDWDNLIQEEASFVPVEANIESASYFSKRPGDDETSFFHPDEDSNQEQEAGFDPFQFRNLKLLHEMNVVKSKAPTSALPTGSLVPELTVTPKSIITLKHNRPINCLVAEDNPVTQLLAKALMQQLGITVTQVLLPPFSSS